MGCSESKHASIPSGIEYFQHYVNDSDQEITRSVKLSESDIVRFDCGYNWKSLTGIGSNPFYCNYDCEIYFVIPPRDRVGILIKKARELKFVKNHH